jgi:hypothetical protein
MKNVISTTLLLLLAPALVWAGDTGFATQVGGEVGFKDGAPLAAFSKLRNGDQLMLGADAKLQIVYFDSGRQETWSGMCSLAIGERASNAKDCQTPAVKQLAESILAALQRTPDLIIDIRNRSGLVRVRAFGPEEQVKAAEQQYRVLRAQTDDADITPELYLFSRQWALQQTTTIADTLAIMAKRQPDSNEVATLRAKYQSMLDAVNATSKTRH